MDLTKLIVQLSDYIFEKETTIKEGVENIMLNKPYMLESERLRKEGFTQGETKWRMEERHDMIINALKRGTTPEQLIHLMGFTEDEIVECQKNWKLQNSRTKRDSLVESLFFALENCTAVGFGIL